MSRATVRAAITDYLANAGIENLSTVKPFPAKFTSEAEFYDGEDPGHSSGAIIYIFFENQTENRVALGGAHDGRKVIEYTVALDCFMRSNHKRSEDAGLDNETFLDSLEAAIRADRNAGAPGVIFQWGEGTFPGSADLTTLSYYPKLLAGAGSATQTYSRVTVSVLEIINS
jgi:hypothetical protein